MLQRWTKWLCPQVSSWLQIIITIIIAVDTLSLGLFIFVNNHYNHHYYYQHQYHGHNCPLVTSSFINLLFKGHSCSRCHQNHSLCHHHQQSSLFIMNHHDHDHQPSSSSSGSSRSCSGCWTLWSTCVRMVSPPRRLSPPSRFFFTEYTCILEEIQKRKKGSFSRSIFGLSFIFQTTDQPILVQAVQIFQMLSNWPNEIISIYQIYYY